MRIVCLHQEGLSQLLRLGAPVKDLTPSGIPNTEYHLVAASVDQLQALQGLGVQHEDVTPKALKSVAPPSATSGFLFCRGGKIPNGLALRTSHKARKSEAEVRGGRIWLNGRPYDNPSDAARGAGHGSANGWLIWEYRDPQDGKWKSLNYLRRKGAA